MAKLNDLLKEMADEMPGLKALGVIGIDGLSIAQYSVNSDFNIDVAAAQSMVIIKLIEKTCAQLGDSVQDDLITTANSYLMIHPLSEGQYYLSIAADRNESSLGNLRLMARQFSEAIWKCIPRKR